MGSHSVDGSWWPLPKFDALLMNQANYDLYVNGDTPSTISDGTKMEQTYEVLLSRIPQFLVPTIIGWYLMHKMAPVVMERMKMVIGFLIS